jgi:hypothetical protein
MIGTIVLIMNYNHPFTSTALTNFATTPILPNVVWCVMSAATKKQKKDRKASANKMNLVELVLGRELIKPSVDGEWLLHPQKRT